MSRTTINLDLPLLRSLKEIAAMEGKSLTQVVTEVVSLGLEARRRQDAAQPQEFQWSTQVMEARIDYGDKDALYQAMGER